MGGKIAIIGLGMIGYELIKKYDNLGYNVHAITRSDKGFFNDNNNIIKHFVDITNESKIKETIENINPDFVVNTAAITNVDLCETERELAYKTNALAAKYIGEACKEVGCSLCHISTDYVFDKFDEDDLNSYPDSGEWKGKAGACMVEGFCKKYIKEIRGLESCARGLQIEKLLPFIR